MTAFATGTVVAGSNATVKGGKTVCFNIEGPNCTGPLVGKITGTIVEKCGSSAIPTTYNFLNKDYEFKKDSSITSEDSKATANVWVDCACEGVTFGTAPKCFGLTTAMSFLGVLLGILLLI